MKHSALITGASAEHGREFARQIATWGSTITKDAPDDKLTLERTKQLTLEGWKRPVKQPRG